MSCTLVSKPPLAHTPERPHYTDHGLDHTADLTGREPLPWAVQALCHRHLDKTCCTTPLQCRLGLQGLLLGSAAQQLWLAACLQALASCCLIVDKHLK